MIYWYETKRQRWKRRALCALKYLLLYIIAFNVMGFVLVFALDQYEVEQQWRADRLCAQGYYCDPKAGP